MTVLDKMHMFTQNGMLLFTVAMIVKCLLDQVLYRIIL